ncbi:flavoprotein [Virgibacillus sp. DJP39]|uniref:flavoprotein n=1 Tax=Virgibacillus sp. DJP39 TaxID=3409790 RepID=UPI003BB741F1
MSSFQTEYENFKNAWESFSIEQLERFVDKDYQAREIREGSIVDFGYEESIDGWTQAFDHFSDKNAEWHLQDIGLIQVKENEMLAILSATLTVEGEQMKTANLFFDTFKNTSGMEWKLVRSYIETGVPLDNLNSISFK